MLDIEKIRLRRCELGLSQQALGKAIGKNQSYIARLENGLITNIMADTLLRLARTLQVPMEALVLDTGETPKQKPKRQAPNADVGAKAAANTQRIPAPQFDAKPSAPKRRCLEDRPAEEIAAEQVRLTESILKNPIEW